jgi:hypothetical protein
MSYDIHLFPLLDGETIDEGLKRTLPGPEEINPGSPAPEKELRKNELADALIRDNPDLEAFEFGFADIAKMLNTDEEEAKRRWRHIELNGPVDGNGIQITLFDDTASITIPYWHAREKAEKVFQELWDCIEVLQREGGYVAYDEQLERVVNRSSDLSDMLSTYCGVTKSLTELGANSAKIKKEWWKFW